MAYYKQIQALVFICLSLLYNNRIEGTKFVEIVNEQDETKEGRSIEAQRSGIIWNLFSDIVSNEQSSDYHVHHAGFLTPSPMLQGTRARISVWGIPNVNYNSESAVFIAVLNENGRRYSMVAGFHVYPKLYSGSTDLRFFAGWTTGNDGKMCFSPLCQGFIVSNVSGAPVPGGTVAPLSIYNGDDYFVTLSIKKDRKTQDWSLYRDDDDNPILIGWWPKTLFNNTFDYATKIVWAGGVLYPKNETSPPMGSGHVGCEGEKKAAYISNIKIFDKYGQPGPPYEENEFTDRSDCFTTGGFKYSYGKAYNFFYGGHAGCNN